MLVTWSLLLCACLAHPAVSYLAIEVLNDIFGFQLQEDYKNGPFYRNDRNVRQTPFAFLPERLNEVGSVMACNVVQDVLLSENLS